MVRVSIHDIYQTDSRKLEKLARLAEGPEDLCGPEEFSAVWRHQLAAPLEFDLTTAIREAQTTYDAARATAPKPPRTFRDLLQSLAPPIELLKLAKDFAKTHALGRERAVPQPIATALYFACIAAALTRCHERITSLDDDNLCRGLKWAGAQTWLDESTRNLLQEGLQVVKPV